MDIEFSGILSNSSSIIFLFPPKIKSRKNTKKHEKMMNGLENTYTKMDEPTVLKTEFFQTLKLLKREVNFDLSSKQTGF